MLKISIFLVTLAVSIKSFFLSFLGNHTTEMIVCGLKKFHYWFGNDLLSQSWNFNPLLFELFTLPFALKVYSLGIFAEINALFLIECFENAFLFQLKKNRLLLCFFYWECKFNLFVAFDWNQPSIFVIFAKWEFLNIWLLFYLGSPFEKYKVSESKKLRIKYFSDKLIFEHFLYYIFPIFAFFWLDFIFY